MIIVCCATHAILGIVASAGPSPDIDQLDGVLDQAPRRQIAIRHLVADAGFDSAYNHHLLRDDHGIRSTIPPEHGRPAEGPGHATDGQVPTSDAHAVQRVRVPQATASGDGELDDEA